MSNEIEKQAAAFQQSAQKYKDVDAQQVEVTTREFTYAAIWYDARLFLKATTDQELSPLDAGKFLVAVHKEFLVKARVSKAPDVILSCVGGMNSAASSGNKPVSKIIRPKGLVQ